MPHHHHRGPPGNRALPGRSPIPDTLLARLDAGIAAVVPDPADRAFALRCVLQEGPTHHRAANAALLLLLVDLTERLGGPWPLPARGDHLQPRMHLPPHLAEHNPDARYPVAMPLAALQQVAPGNVAMALADALVDGPPQHSVANVLMVALLEGVLAHVPGAPR